MNNLFQSHGIELTDIIHTIGDALCVADCNYNILAANEIFAAWYGKELHEIIDQNVFNLNPNFKTSVFYESALITLNTGEPTTRIGFSTVFNKWIIVRTCKLGENVIWYAHELKDGFDKIGY
jgi:hypothetical protein